MEITILERFRTSLIEKHEEITEWLQKSSMQKKRILLGPSDEHSVQDHLDVICECITEAESGTLGICDVCDEYIETDLLEIDYTSEVCLSHLSGAERHQLEADLELAKTVQKALLPRETPTIPGLEIAAFSRPAQIIGGDYFDFLEFKNGIHCLAIADVAGHGMSAGLHMASVQAMFQSLVPIHDSPAEVLRQIQKLFIHNTHFTSFVSIFIGAFNPSTKILTYSNAGHNPPIILRKLKSVNDLIQWLNPTGAAIGLIEEADFEERSISLDVGDWLVMYTDGVVEAVNHQHEEFGSKRLVTIIEALHDNPPLDVIQGIRQGLEKFSNGNSYEDDITVVVARVR